MFSSFTEVAGQSSSGGSQYNSSALNAFDIGESFVFRCVYFSLIQYRYQYLFGMPEISRSRISAKSSRTWRSFHLTITTCRRALVLWLVSLSITGNLCRASKRRTETTTCPKNWPASRTIYVGPSSLRCRLTSLLEDNGATGIKLFSISFISITCWRALCISLFWLLRWKCFVISITCWRALCIPSFSYGDERERYPI